MSEITGPDREAMAWAWLEKAHSDAHNDAVDKDYSADQMVDAYHAGASFTPLLAQIADLERRLVEEQERCAIAAFYAHQPDEKGDADYAVGHHNGVNAAVAAIRALPETKENEL